MLRKMMISGIAAALMGTALQAAEVEVKILNMTGGNYFTPLLVGVHSHNMPLFSLGSAASVSLQAMAEGGDISGLSSNIQAEGGSVSENPAGGLLAPGQSTMTTLSSSATNNALSIAAMILPTNDGFVALNNWSIPSEPGTYTVLLNAYDAGTEANDEIVNGGAAVGTPGIPADPGAHNGTGGTGVSAEIEGFVTIHRGILGDQDPTGGASDLDSSMHRWLNPIAKAVITVQ